MSLTHLIFTITGTIVISVSFIVYFYYRAMQYKKDVRLLHAMIDSFKTPACITRDDHVVFANKEYLKSYTYGDFSEHITGESPLSARNQSRITGDSMETRFECLMTDGSYYLWHISPIEGYPAYNVLVGMDITEQHQRESKALTEAIIDPLTGVYNQNYLNNILEDPIENIFPLTVLMADIDDLKDTNDRYGHAAGDELIKLTARSLKQGVRNRDIIIRIGGDEFIGLIRNTDPSNFKAIEERIQSMAAGYGVRLSLGMSICESAGNYKHALDTADRNMYADKRERKRLLS